MVSLLSTFGVTQWPGWWARPWCSYRLKQGAGKKRWLSRHKNRLIEQSGPDRKELPPV